MRDREAAKLISRIQQHFSAKAWIGLQRVAVNDLTALTAADLSDLAQKVEAAPDRMEAMTAVQEAIRLGNEQTPIHKYDGDSKDSAILGLRPDG